jgi:hypothetical protein
MELIGTLSEIWLEKVSVAVGPIGS